MGGLTWSVGDDEVCWDVAVDFVDALCYSQGESGEGDGENFRASVEPF